ncbi:MAG: SMP-30/gluconolactonase/LRE family protein [Silvibacterium sp.]
MTQKAKPDMTSRTMFRIVLAWIACTVCIAALHAQVVEVPVHIERLNPALDHIVPAQPRLERVATGFTWLEGPVWIPRNGGYLLFADIPGNSIRKVLPNGAVSIFMQPSGYIDSAPFNGPQPGSNGMTIDPHGRLVIAGNGARNVFRLETINPKAIQTVLADSYQGKRLNSPNDLVFRSNGDLYFTDPPYGLPMQNDKDPHKQLTVNGLYLVRGAGSQKPGTPPNHAAIHLLVGDLSRPNGLALSPDEKYLYLDNTEPQKLWLRFRIKPDGTLTDRTVLADATADKRRGSPDGMKVDSFGNIYSAGPGGIWILSPSGKHLGTIDTPEVVSNLAWGGSQLNVLYITTQSSVYSIRLKAHGIPMLRK